MVNSEGKNHNARLKEGKNFSCRTSMLSADVDPMSGGLFFFFVNLSCYFNLF